MESIFIILSAILISYKVAGIGENELTWTICLLPIIVYLSVEILYAIFIKR